MTSNTHTHSRRNERYFGKRCGSAEDDDAEDDDGREDDGGPDGSGKQKIIRLKGFGLFLIQRL